MPNFLEFLILAAAVWLGWELRRLRRDATVARGLLYAIESRADEAVGRLTVLTAEHAGGYESDDFADVSDAGRERLLSATAGATNPGAN